MARAAIDGPHERERHATRARPMAQRDRPIVAGVGISHPERVLFPVAGATKLDLARYYESIADWIVPHVNDRPLTLVHCPKGIPSGGARKGVDCVFMKHAKAWGPSALRRVRIREKTKVGEYLIADSAAAVVALAQMDVLEIHTWNSRFADVERPDRLVIDLDPGADIAWPAVVSAARLARELLGVLELESFVKTTGGRGLHVVVPIAPSADWAACLEFARAFALSLVRRQPALFTEQFSKAGRHDRILIDYLRNNRTNTSIAAYSTRAKPEAPVSVPLTWTELSPSRTPDRFTIATVPTRLARLRADPWKDYWSSTQRIPRHAVAALERM
jgi:bifunctional non-homologous end joining protein LigD